MFGTAKTNKYILSSAGAASKYAVLCKRFILWQYDASSWIWGPSRGNDRGMYIYCKIASETSHVVRACMGGLAISSGVLQVFRWLWIFVGVKWICQNLGRKSQYGVSDCCRTIHFCHFIGPFFSRQDDGDESLQIDFANKYLGGGVLHKGCVQEEIRSAGWSHWQPFS